MISRNMNSILERIQSNLEETLKVDVVPGEDSNTYNVRDEFFDMMDPIIEHLQLSYGMRDSQAWDLTAAVGDKLWERGVLPPFPDDDMSDSHVARWVNAASYSDFMEAVLKYASLRSADK